VPTDTIALPPFPARRSSDLGALRQLPSGSVLIVVGVVLLLAGAVMAIGSLRRWVVAKVRPTLQQVWPRLVWVIGQPHRLALALRSEEHTSALQSRFDLVCRL